MKVFISWSGEASREIALALRDWFPKVIQGIQPFVSAKDMDKGAQWTQVLAGELNDSDFGVVCLTPANLLSPWLNYEAGAIMSSVDSRVCPVLLGVEKGEVQPPLSQLQLTALDVDDFVLLMNSMNKAAGSPLDITAVDETVRVWWPQLQERVGGIEIPTHAGEPQKPAEPPKPQSSIEEMVQEILSRLRRIEAQRPRNIPDDRLRAERLAMGLGELIPSKESPLSQRISEIMDMSGIPFQRIVRLKDDRFDVHCLESLPSPLPFELWSALGELTAQTSITIRLRDNFGRVVRFFDGIADEPPA
jgi:TIR domain